MLIGFNVKTVISGIFASAKHACHFISSRCVCMPPLLSRARTRATAGELAAVVSS